MNDLKVFVGRANKPLGLEICEHLSVPPGRVEISEFADGEIYVRIDENVRESDVFLVQSTSPPSNTHLMELLIVVDALKRASAGRITAVIPYYGYARQDRRDNLRVPITAKLVADLLVTSGVQRILALDLHAGQIQGFFNVPVDHLYATPVLVDYLERARLTDVIIVSPDAGGVQRARAYAKRLNVGLAIIDKRREATEKNKAIAANVIGEVADRDCIIVDDMIDTAGTLVEAATILKTHGAARVFALSTHGLFSGPAFKRIEESPIEQVIVTNSIAQTIPDHLQQRFTILKIGHFLADAMLRIHTGSSVSKLIG